jgi:hypothetical protein
LILAAPERPFLAQFRTLRSRFSRGNANAKPHAWVESQRTQQNCIEVERSAAKGARLRCFKRRFSRLESLWCSCTIRSRKSAQERSEVENTAWSCLHGDAALKNEPFKNLSRKQ